MKKNENNNYNITLLPNSFCSILTLLFIGLKLTGHITWSWFWVLSPVIFSVSMMALIVGVMLLILLIAFICSLAN